MAFQNDKPTDSITWPFGADSGDTRIVVGADTPDVLLSYGIRVAILFYMKDAQSGLEVGYFFIGSSSTLDAGNDGNVMLMGHVIYPTPGDPDSPTSVDAKTHFQISMDEGEDEPLVGPTTRFKDYPVVFNGTVPSVEFDGPVDLNHAVDVTEFGTVSVQDGASVFVNSNGEIIFQNGSSVFTDTGSEMVFGGDRTFFGWPVGAEELIFQSNQQGTSQVNPTEEYNQELFVTGLPAGLYSFDTYLSAFGPAQSGGNVAKIMLTFEVVGTVVVDYRFINSGPPDTIVLANHSRTMGYTQTNRQIAASKLAYGVSTSVGQVSIHEHMLLQFTSDNNEVYLKFMRHSGIAPAGDVVIQAGSHMIVKRWL